MSRLKAFPCRFIDLHRRGIIFHVDAEISRNERFEKDGSGILYRDSETGHDWRYNNTRSSCHAMKEESHCLFWRSASIFFMVSMAKKSFVRATTSTDLTRHKDCIDPRLVLSSLYILICKWLRIRQSMVGDWWASDPARLTINECQRLSVKLMTQGILEERIGSIGRVHSDHQHHRLTDSSC